MGENFSQSMYVAARTARQLLSLLASVRVFCLERGNDTLVKININNKTWDKLEAHGKTLTKRLFGGPWPLRVSGEFLIMASSSSGADLEVNELMKRIDFYGDF